MANRILTCGARLRPGALPLLTRLPASDFTDRSAPLEDVFGARGRLLMEQLAGIKSPIRAITIIGDFLSREFACQSYLPQLPLTQGNRVDEMAAQLGMPTRTLHSRLMQHVGLSPKHLLRVARLHRTLAIAQNRPLSWAQVAALGGFADQAHMIREFRDLLGESPTTWNRRSSSADLFKTTTLTVN